MVKKKEQLFHLVKSLNKEEKRNFKLHVSRYSSNRENNYIRLFNAIEKQDSYDEQAIKRQFKDETFVKQLTVTKNYLQKQILKSLQNLYHDETDDLNALVLLHQIAILFKKGHYEMCRSLVKKGIELCAENELFLEWIGFLKWEIDLNSKTNIEEYKRSLSYYFEHTSRLLKLYEITTQGNHLTNQIQILSLSTSNLSTLGSDYQELIKNIESVINTADIDTLPIRTKYTLFFPLAQSYMAVNEYKKAYYTYQFIYENLRNSYEEKHLHEEFVNTLTGLIYSGGAVNKPETVKSAIEELQQVPDINQHIKFKKSESLSYYPLLTAALAGDINNGLTAIEIAESFLEEQKGKLSQLHYFFAYYYAAHIYMNMNNKSMALRYLRKFDAFQGREYLPNLVMASRFMEIVIFYEQSKYDLMESRLRSLQRQIQKETDTKPHIHQFIDLFQKLMLCERNSAKEKELMADFRSQFQQLDISERIILFVHFDFISWLDSQIEGCSFAEKIRQNGVKLFAVDQ